MNLDNGYRPVKSPTTGYELTSDLYHNFFAVFPVGTTNLFPNPSFEEDTAGYLAGNAVFSRVTYPVMRGQFCLKVVPSASGQASYVEYRMEGSTLLPNTSYVWSFDLQANIGDTFNVQVSNQNSYIITVAKSTPVRYVYVFTTAASIPARHDFFITRSAGNMNPWYFDGNQLEKGIYATTYGDGSLPKHNWLGTAHNSPSQRLEGAAGGITVSFKNLGLRLYTTQGLELPPVENVLSSQGYNGWSIYDGTLLRDRKFSFVVALEGENQQDLENQIKQLNSLFMPYQSLRSAKKLRFVYQTSDSSGYKGVPIYWDAVYDGGAEGEVNNLFQMRYSLNFIQIGYPQFLEEYGQSQVLNFSQSFTSNYLARRKADGTWDGLSGGANNSVYNILVDRSGNQIFAGAFTTLGGVTANRLAKIDATSTVTQIGTAGADARMVAIAASKTSNIFYLGGYCATPGNRLLESNQNLIEFAGGVGGTTGSHFVSSIAVDNLNRVWAVGNFPSNQGHSHLFLYDPLTSQHLTDGSGFNGTARNIIKLQNGKMLIVGSFNSANGTQVGGMAVTADGESFERLISSTSGIEGGTIPSGYIGSGSNSEPSVYAAGQEENGQILVGGDFLKVGTKEIPFLARVRNKQVYAVGLGVNGPVLGIYPVEEGLLIVGRFTTTKDGSVQFPSSACVWNGVELLPVDFVLPTTVGSDNYGYFTAANTAFYQRGTLLLGTSRYGTATSGATNQVENKSSAEVYPEILFEGPGQIQQVRNYRTGGSLYFNNCILAVGEKATLSLAPGRITFTSNYRGNILATLFKSSNFPGMVLLPGDQMTSGVNNIGCFLTGTTSATRVTMYWRHAHVGISGGTYE